MSFGKPAGRPGLYYAGSLKAHDDLKRIRAMILVDMIGDRNLHIHRESNSDPQLSNLVFQQAQALGYARNFIDRPVAVEDDHLPFLKTQTLDKGTMVSGIPAIDLITLPYGPLNFYWHTRFDTWKSVVRSAWVSWAESLCACSQLLKPLLPYTPHRTKNRNPNGFLPPTLRSAPRLRPCRDWEWSVLCRLRAGSPEASDAGSPCGPTLGWRGSRQPLRHSRLLRASQLLRHLTSALSYPAASAGWLDWAASIAHRQILRDFRPLGGLGFAPTITFRGFDHLSVNPIVSRMTDRDLGQDSGQLPSPLRWNRRLVSESSKHNRQKWQRRPHLRFADVTGQSFKVFYFQETTRRLVDALASIAPEGRPVDHPFFNEILRQGTGRMFSMEDNEHWRERAGPIVEAFFHTRYFLEMAVKYAEIERTAQPAALRLGGAALPVRPEVSPPENLRCGRGPSQ